jgi:hypothetical protein
MPPPIMTLKQLKEVIDFTMTRWFDGCYPAGWCVIGIVGLLALVMIGRYMGLV